MWLVGKRFPSSCWWLVAGGHGAKYLFGTTPTPYLLVVHWMLPLVLRVQGSVQYCRPSVSARLGQHMRPLLISNRVLQFFFCEFKLSYQQENCLASFSHAGWEKTAFSFQKGLAWGELEAMKRAVYEGEKVLFIWWMSTLATGESKMPLFQFGEGCCFSSNTRVSRMDLKCVH